MRYLAKRRENREKSDKIKKTRERIEEINDLHLSSINDQLDITNCRLQGFIDRKSQILIEYVRNLRVFSTDDIGQAILDNLNDSIREIRSQLVSILEDIQNYDGDSGLEQSNFITSKIEELLSLINRLEDIETILHTHLGESHTEDN